MKKEFKMLPPIMPNFLPFEIETSDKPDGGNSNQSHVAVHHLTEQEAVEYGELMKQAFISHWKNKKNNQLK